jgi:hypothetical protein
MKTKNYLPWEGKGGTFSFVAVFAGDDVRLSVSRAASEPTPLHLNA